MIRFVLLFLFVAFSVASSRGATQMTPHQRRVADEVVGKRISVIQNEIVTQPGSANLESSILELAKRKKEWLSDCPAAAVGSAVQECRDRHVPVPASINEQVVDDIIWQFENPYGDEWLDRKRHKATCAWALGQIGHPKGVPFIIQALAQAGEEHTPWLGLVGIADERLIPAIEKYLDFSNQQPAFPAISSLARTGEQAVPVLQRFLEGPDRNWDESAVNALIRIGKPSCIKVLKNYLNTADPLLTRKIQSGLLRIQCRAIDKIYTPPTLPAQDEARLWHLTELAIFEPSLRLYRDPAGEAPKTRQEAEEALVKIGAIAVGIIQPRLSDPTHFDHFGNSGLGEEFFVSDRAANMLRRIGTPAVPALIDALCSEQRFARENVAKVLRQLTGQNFGFDYNQWSQWFLNRQNQQTPV